MAPVSMENQIILGNEAECRYFQLEPRAVACSTLLSLHGWEMLLHLVLLRSKMSHMVTVPEGCGTLLVLSCTWSW